MSDLISRRVAIDAVCEHGTDLERRGITVLSVANHKQATVDLLEQLPPAQQWIPVSERLPEAAIDVLVCNDDQKQAVAIMQTQDFYGHTMKEWYIKYCLYDWDVWDEDADGRIVAWMPLPEPWRGEEDE